MAPTTPSKEDDLLPYKLQGDFVVAVGHAFAEVVSPQEAPGVPNDADIAFRITVIAPNLSCTAEGTYLGGEQVLGAVRALYTMQRASNSEEHGALPATYADPYDVMIYIGDMLRGWDDRVEEREAQDRFKTEPPEWVAT